MRNAGRRAASGRMERDPYRLVVDGVNEEPWSPPGAVSSM
jgi:hypothetical protein